MLPDGAKVGDVFKVEASIALDGIEILSVVPSRSARKGPDRLEIIGGADFQAVTTSLVGRRDRGDRGGDRRERRDGDRRPAGERRPQGDRPRRDADDRARRGSDERSRRPRPEGESAAAHPPKERRTRPTYAPVPEVPQRPKPKRLKPGRAHRQELMGSLPEEQQPIADQLFRAGLPGVRQALQDQNAALAAEGKPQIKTTGIEALAQDLLPRVRVAEWLDRADAALAVVDELDLRDLRSVVTAAADPVVARDDSTRELAAQLRAALERRQNEEHEQWLADITAALDVGRVVRALRLSSRPPKAGVPFPPELGTRLSEAATASLTADAASDRWAAVIEALAFAPVHAVVTPAAPPSVISDELRSLVKSLAGAVPQIAALFGIEPPPPGSRPARAPRLPRRPSKPKPATAKRPPPPPSARVVAEQPEPAAEPEPEPVVEPETAAVEPEPDPEPVVEPETAAVEPEPEPEPVVELPTATVMSDPEPEPDPEVVTEDG